MRISLSFAFICYCLLASASLSGQSPKLVITPLTGDFYIYTTYGDPGNGSLFPANGMYMLTKKGAVVFDTPWDSTQFQPLLDSIEARHHQKVILCIATHFHADRTIGLSYYKRKGIPTYTTVLTDEISRQREMPRASNLVANDSSFQVGGHLFQTIYPGKGHSPDNIVIWFPEESILYGGCFIKSTEAKTPGNLSDANIDEWIVSLNKIQSMCRNPAFVIPGHQSWESNKAVEHSIEVMRKFKEK